MAFRTVVADLLASGKLTGNYTLTGTITAGEFIGNTFIGSTFSGASFTGGTFTGSTFTGSTFEGTDWLIDSDGAFFYQGTPAAGNPPVVSIAAPGVSADPFGNPVAPIMTIGQLTSSYVQAGTNGQLSLVNAAGVTVITLHPASGKIQFYDTATGVLKMVVQENSIASSNGTLSLSSGVTTIAGDVALGMTLLSQDAASGSSPAVVIAPGVPSRLSTALVELQGLLTVLAASGSLSLVTLENNTVNPTNPTLQIVASAAGDKGIGIETAADTFNRWLLTTAAIKAGPGNVTQDTIQYRTGPANWAMDPIALNLSGTAETWHAVTSFSNSWTNGASRVPCSYRLVPSPENSVQLAGSLTVPAGPPALPSSVFTLPAAYQPPFTKSFLAREVTRNTLVLMTVSTAGVVQVQAGTLTAGDTIDFDYLYPVDV